MVKLALEEMGLPEIGPDPAWREKLNATGWTMAIGPVEPAASDIAELCRPKERRLGIAYDLLGEDGPKIVEGTPDELCAWIEEHRPALTDPALGKMSVYRSLSYYREDPAHLTSYWEICDEVERGDLQLAVDVGDA